MQLFSPKRKVGIRLNRKRFADSHMSSAGFIGKTLVTCRALDVFGPATRIIWNSDGGGGWRGSECVHAAEILGSEGETTSTSGLAFTDGIFQADVTVFIELTGGGGVAKVGIDAQMIITTSPLTFGGGNHCRSRSSAGSRTSRREGKPNFIGDTNSAVFADTIGFGDAGVAGRTRFEIISGSATRSP